MTSNRTQSETQTRRRTIVQLSSAISIGALAGCLGDGDQSGPSGNESATTSTPETPGPFEDVLVGKQAIDITLRTGTDVDQINVINPEGQVYRKAQVSNGVTSVSIPLEPDYIPGKQELLAIDSDTDETIARTSVNVAPALSMETIERATNVSEKELPREVTYPSSELHIVVNNSGNGPAYLNGYRTTGTPPTGGQDFSDTASNSYLDAENSDLELGSSSIEYVRIPPGSSASIFTDKGALTIVPNGDISENCSKEPQQARFTFKLTQSTGDPLTQSYQYIYSNEDDDAWCELGDLIQADSD